MNFQLLPYPAMQLVKKHAANLDIKTLLALGQTSTEWRDFVDGVFKEMKAIDCVVPSKRLAMKLLDRCDGQKLEMVKFVLKGTNETIDLFESYDKDYFTLMIEKYPLLFESYNN